jgi:hypothetical protein
VKHLFLFNGRPAGETPEPGSDAWMETLRAYRMTEAAGSASLPE